MLAVLSSSAHRIEYYTTNGCIVPGQSLQIDAKVVAAPASTRYRWQYKTATGSWTCFTDNANNTINGTAFYVSHASGSGADNAPQLTIASPGQALDNVQLRCLMCENNDPCSAPSNTVYGGDGLNQGEVKVLRLRYNAVAGACSISCTNNLLSNSDGFYGGFEAVTYSNGSFTDKNFLSGAAGSDLTANGSNNGSYRSVNNPFAAYGFSNAKFAPHSGNYQMVVKGNNSATARVWYKTVTVQPGEVYSFSAWMSKVDGTTPRLQLKAGSQELASAQPAAAAGSWTQVNGTYAVPPGVTSVVFAIYDKDAASGAHNYVLDDICLVKTADPISIGDKVWFDVNRNGRQDAGEPGIGGATVKLFYDNDMNNVADTVNPVYTATTNSSGNYLFQGVIPGKYFVQFTLVSGYDGFTVQDAAGVPVGQNSTANVNTGKTGTHDFTADYLFKDAGMVKNISISGKVYNDANGLTDNTVNGALIAAAGNATLYANLYRGTTFVASVPVSGGSYTFSNLPGNTSYTISLSTTAATSGSPAPVLPSGWANTGEFAGTGPGNDGTADGLLTISLGAAPVNDASFGIEQLPTAGTATAPARPNPGDTFSVVVPPATFSATDPAPGTVTAITIMGIPAQATSITVNGTKYTAANFPANGITIPAGANGQPTQTIAVDPIDGTVTVNIPFKAIDNAGLSSANTGIAKVPVNEVPDLTPVITVAPSTLYGNTTFSARVDIWNLSNVSSTGTIKVFVTKSALISYTYNPSLSMSMGSSVQNQSWTLDATSNTSYYIFTTSVSIEPQGKLSFGLNGALTPGSTKGQLTNTVIINPGSGGESLITNNADAEIIRYFPN